MAQWVAIDHDQCPVGEGDDPKRYVYEQGRGIIGRFEDPNNAIIAANCVSRHDELVAALQSAYDWLNLSDKTETGQKIKAKIKSALFSSEAQS